MTRRYATKLPLQVQAGKIVDADLVRNGVRVVGFGHVPYMTMLKGLYDGQKHLRDGGSVADLQDRVLPPELQKQVLGEASYALYITHLLVWVYCKIALERSGIDPQATWVFPVYAAVALGVSVVTFRGVETPARKRLLAR